MTNPGSAAGRLPGRCRHKRPTNPTPQRGTGPERQQQAFGDGFRHSHTIPTTWRTRVRRPQIYPTWSQCAALSPDRRCALQMPTISGSGGNHQPLQLAMRALRSASIWRCETQTASFTLAGRRQASIRQKSRAKILVSPAQVCATVFTGGAATTTGAGTGVAAGGAGGTASAAASLAANIRSSWIRWRSAMRAARARSCAASRSASLRWSRARTASTAWFNCVTAGVASTSTDMGSTAEAGTTAGRSATDTGTVKAPSATLATGA